MPRFLANSAEALIGSNPIVSKSGGLFRQPLIDMLNLKYPLVKLAEVIDWDKVN
jgi:IS5 family transposase